MGNLYVYIIACFVVLAVIQLIIKIFQKSSRSANICGDDVVIEISITTKELEKEELDMTKLISEEPIK